MVLGTAVSGHILGHVPDQYHSSNSVTVQVLEAAAARLTGNNSVDTLSFFVSVFTPIGAHIPIKVKEKIWANQFIEFHELLSPNPWESSTAETGEYTSQEPAADKAGRQQNTTQEPLTLAQWTTAWNSFTAVLTVVTRAGPSTDTLYGGCPPYSRKEGRLGLL